MQEKAVRWSRADEWDDPPPDTRTPQEKRRDREFRRSVEATMRNRKLLLETMGQMRKGLK